MTASPSQARAEIAQRQIADAYRHCESLTRAAAGNFYYGIRLLARPQRRAMCAVYAFARRIDDIGDGTLSREQKLALLSEQQQALGAIDPTGGSQAGGVDPVMVALADAYRRFPLPADALPELIEGVRMDLDGIVYERFEDLLVYCRRVAGGIGRLSLAIFGGRELERAFALADELGVALQLTNILRDVREDAHNGRVYLPLVELEQFGVLARTGHGEDAAGRLLARITGPGPGPPELHALVHFQVRRARVWFERGSALVELLDRRSGACVLAMSGIYRRVLERIDEDPAGALSQRVSLSGPMKAGLALRAVLGVRA